MCLSWPKNEIKIRFLMYEVLLASVRPGTVDIMLKRIFKVSKQFVSGFSIVVLDLLCDLRTMYAV